MDIVGIFHKLIGYSNYGYVESEQKSFVIQDSTDSLNAINGDIVVYNQENSKIIKIVKRFNKPIIGILSLSSRVVLNLTKKGMPRKKFMPLNNKFPPFAVSTRKPLQSRDVYAVIRFDRWETSDKYPIANLERIIGNIGDYNAEVEFLKLKYDIRWKNINRINLDYYLRDLTEKHRQDFAHLTTISIDPPGCKDIDDALHCRDLTDGCVEFGIHIADVSSYIDEGSELDNLIKIRGESVYLPDEQMNMLPTKLATDICSLLEGKRRRTFSVIFKLNNNFEIVDVEFIKGIIINKKALSYDEAQNIVENSDANDIAIIIRKLYRIGKVFYNKQKGKRLLLINSNEEYDVHKMVEIFMILANVSVAEKLSKTLPEKTIIRSHSGIKDKQVLLEDKNNSIDSIDMNMAIKMINTMKMEKAKYHLSNNVENIKHVGLGESIYTHFTSPIRRYVDIVVHRVLNYIINDTYEPKNIDINLCNSLNISHSNIKQAEREFCRLNKVYELYNNNDSILETFGIVISINENILTLYVPQLKIDLECKAFSDRLKLSTDYYWDDSRLVIKNKNDDSEDIQIKILQKVKIRIVVSIKEPYVRRKLLVQLF